jgi:tryptophan synthase alpha chain
VRARRAAAPSRAIGRAGRIGAAFRRARDEGRAAFVPFLMAGDPDLGATAARVEALAAAGSDVVELGVPFSDPIADGPVNQAAAARALEAGATLGGVLDLVATLRRRIEVPLVLFSYFNPIHRAGVRRFAERAAAAGADGVLCVDLPPEEAAGEYLDSLARHGLDPVFLLAPTSTRERMRAVARAGRGFVYYVSRTGVTGERAELPEGLAREVREVRRRVELPVAVGFGIATPEQVRAVARIADGVVVGSALVRLAAEPAPGADPAQRVGARAAELVAATARG